MNESLDYIIGTFVYNFKHFILYFMYIFFLANYISRFIKLYNIILLIIKIYNIIKNEVKAKHISVNKSLLY